MKPLLVLPTYNEIENLEDIAAAILREVPENLDLLVVDDNSPDGTGKRADELAADQPRLRVLHRPGKGGLGPAYIAGFRWALEQGYDAIITFDADFSHPVDKLPYMIEKLAEADVVVGSRYARGGKLEGWPLHRWILSRSANLYASTVSGMPLHDCTGGFNALRRSVLEAIELEKITTRGYAFMHELKYRSFRHGFRFHEFPITFRDRRLGVSKMSGGIIFEAFFKVLSLRFESISPDSTAAAGSHARAE